MHPERQHLPMLRSSLRVNGANPTVSADLGERERRQSRIMESSSGSAPQLSGDPRAGRCDLLVAARLDAQAFQPFGEYYGAD